MYERYDGLMCMPEHARGIGMEEVIVENYEEAERFLAEIPKFTKKNLFEETKAFYAYIQSCDKGQYSETNLGSIIHVAGTNGKGSVCAFMQQICLESGYKTGMFTSPHLVTTRERFCIDGKIISEEAFVEAFNWLTQMLCGYHNKKYCPTYFERLFFMAVYLFTKEKVDVTVLETGLGGRLDTTNIIASPTLTIITQIGLDHMEYLGDTIEKIASEKAGIIKCGVPVVFSDRKIQSSAVIRKKATEYGCKCYAVSKNDYKINEIQKKYIDFSVVSRYYDYCGFTAYTTAVYQVENAAIAIRACEILQRDSNLKKITIDSIHKGIKKMRWAGRMEEIEQRIYIDGAHNEDGIEAFVQSVKEMTKVMDGKNIKYILIFSVMKDKQYDRMIEMLCNLCMITEFVVTHIPGERGAKLTELKEKFSEYTNKNIHIYEKIEDAIEYSILSRKDQGVVYIVGSLYLAGFVEKFFVDKRAGRCLEERS